MARLPRFKTEHFKFYYARGRKPPEARRIGLKGQFEGPRQAPRRHYAYKMTHFGNPVSKNGRRVYNRVTHLAWYALAGAREATRTVVIENQFGKEILVLGDPRLLLVPAIKQKYPKPRRARIPIDVSHFKGYRVMHWEHHTIRTYKLKDQFDAKPVSTRVYPPVFFCLPVEKYVGSKKHLMRNPKEHLTIYPIMPRPYREARSAWDQFGGDSLSDFYARFLAVPTLKHEVRKGYAVD